MRRATYILALCVAAIAMVLIFTASTGQHRSPQPKPWPRYLGNVQPSADRSIAEAVGRFDGWVRAEAANQAEQEIAASVQAQAALVPTAISAPTVTPPSSSPVTVEGSSEGSGDGYSVAQWALVSQCENGGSWIPQGPAYPDGIGLTAQNWAQFGGGSDTSPSTTAAVGNAFLAYYGMSIPDQDGCGGGY